MVLILFIFLIIKIFSINTTKLFIPYVIAVVLMAMMNALVRGLGKIKLYSLVVLIVLALFTFVVMFTSLYADKKLEEDTTEYLVRLER